MREGWGEGEWEGEVAAYHMKPLWPVPCSSSPAWPSGPHVCDQECHQCTYPRNKPWQDDGPRPDTCRGRSRTTRVPPLSRASTWGFL